jgi:phenylacetate-CoA ligase
LMRGFSALQRHVARKSNLRAIVYTGEHLDERLREYLSARYRIESFSLYSSIELGFVGAECEAHDGDHIWADAIVPHIAEVRGLPDITFKQSGDLVRGRFGATQLLHEGSPALLYDTGDLVCFTPSRCQCGRTLPRIKFLSRDADLFSIYSTKLSFSLFQRIAYPECEEDITNLLQLIVTDDRQAVLITLVLPIESLYPVDQRATIIQQRLQSEPSLAFLIDHRLIRFRLSFRTARYFRTRKLTRVQDLRDSLRTSRIREVLGDAQSHSSVDA